MALERIQKTALAIIRGRSHISYTQWCFLHPVLQWCLSNSRMSGNFFWHPQHNMAFDEFLVASSFWAFVSLYSLEVLGSWILEVVLSRMVVTLPLLCFIMREHSNPLLTISFQHWRIARSGSALTKLTSRNTLSDILSEIYQNLFLSIDKRTTCSCCSWQDQ